MTAVTPRRSGRRRAAGAALAAAAWAAIWAAALAGGHLGRGGTAQIAFAAIMATCAMGETLFPPGAAGRYGRLGIVAFTSCCVLVLAVGSAALGAGWGTSLLTTLAVACTIASSAVHRLGRQRSGCSLRTGLPSPARAENDADPSPWPTPPGRATTTRSESFADRVGSGV